MALTAELTCPSGAVFKIQALKGSSLDKLVEYASERNRKARSEVGYMGLIVQEAVTEVLDTGPYNTKTLKPGPEGIVNVSGLLIGDVTYILAHTRLITVGPELQFEHSCPSCKHRSSPVADLTQITGHAYSTEAIEAFRSGTPVYKVIEGNKVGFIPATCTTLEYQSKVQKSGSTKGFSLMQAAMIAHVEGLKFPDNRADIADWVAELDFIALGEMQEQTDELDGGIDLLLQITCTECGHESEVAAPLVRPLEAKEALKPKNLKFLRSLKESDTSPDFSAFRLTKTTGANSSSAPE